MHALSWPQSSATATALSAWEWVLLTAQQVFKSLPSQNPTLPFGVTLQAWYATHPPKRGKWWMGTRPFVHQGFLKSWTANGLNARLVERCVLAVKKMQTEAYGAPIKVYITGACLAWPRRRA